MAETASTAEDRALDALTKILESAISPDMIEAQKIILRRLALAGDLFPSRVPAPLNISEVGGYLNLLADDEPGGGGPLQVVSRQLDSSAPNAGDVASATWDLWSCTASTCTQASVTDFYLAVTPVLNAAGWHQPALAAPTTLTDSGGWNRWTNVTGLVAGVTQFGDELTLLYSAGAIAQSSVREQLDWVWDGS